MAGTGGVGASHSHTGCVVWGISKWFQLKAVCRLGRHLSNSMEHVRMET